jgi:hypothetical protein
MTSMSPIVPEEVLGTSVYLLSKLLTRRCVLPHQARALAQVFAASWAILLRI